MNPPDRCRKCGGPWKPDVHAYMGRVISDKLCVFCGESIHHRGVPKKPKRKSKHIKPRLCLGCHQIIDDAESSLKRYHDSHCKWLRVKRLKKNG